MSGKKETITFTGNPDFDPNKGGRTHMARLWGFIFFFSTIFGILTLVVLFTSIANDNFTTVIVVDTVPRESLVTEAGKDLEDHSRDALAQIIFDRVDVRRLRTEVRNNYPVPMEDLARSRGITYYDLEFEDLKALLLDHFSKEQMWNLIERDVLAPVVEASFPLWETWFGQENIQARLAEIEEWAALDGARPRVYFKSWFNWDFLDREQSKVALYNGIRTAIFGSFFTILVAILFALPIGIAAAVYLEEFAPVNRLSKLIQTNIYNLAGVPSIIYGMLGLAIFVRLFEPLTSGRIFGFTEVATGRTILGAGLTLAFLILPMLIINTQEALRAIPQSLRQSGLAVGATKLRVIWDMVLPQAIDRILTGTVFSISRAIGDTASVVVVGASAFLTINPDSLFSSFTTLPMQIYIYAANPNPEFRHVSAAAILVLLGLLLTMNATAIFLRNYYRGKKEAHG